MLDHERRLGALEGDVKELRTQSTLRDSQVTQLGKDMTELKAATGEQTVILHKVSGGITVLKWIGAALCILVPAIWAIYLHFFAHR